MKMAIDSPLIVERSESAVIEVHFKDDQGEPRTLCMNQVTARELIRRLQPFVVESR